MGRCHSSGLYINNTLYDEFIFYFFPRGSTDVLNENKKSFKSLNHENKKSKPGW